MPQIVQVSDSTVALFVREYFGVGFLKTKPMLANIRDLKLSLYIDLVGLFNIVYHDCPRMFLGGRD
jgi:hypothetical protein